MDTYIQNICRSASYALYKISRIRNYLDEKSTETLIHAFITCRIDQCNSLLYGLPDSHIAKLQRIQNSAARLVTRTRFHDHITPVLQKLHWLPVRYRIMYKILILTYKCIHGFAPLYLQELIQECKPTRNLRSSSKLNLISATVSTLTYGHRSFYKASAELWNNLPMHVKSCRTVSLFKSSLNCTWYGILLATNAIFEVQGWYGHENVCELHTYSKLLLMIKFNCWLITVGHMLLFRFNVSVHCNCLYCVFSA